MPPSNTEEAQHEHLPPQGSSRSSWRLKKRHEYIEHLSEKEKGKHEKLDQQPNRYFKRKRLADIVSLHGQHYNNEDKELLCVFIHFLKGRNNFCVQISSPFLHFYIMLKLTAYLRNIEI